MKAAAVIVAGLAFFLAFKGLQKLRRSPWPDATLWILALLPALAGYGVPSVLALILFLWMPGYLRRMRAKARQKAAFRAAPALLDLAAALMASGSSMQEGLIHAAAEETDPLSQAIQRAHQRSRMGEPFLRALQKVSEEEGIWVGQFLARTLHIHESLGVPLSRTLREEAQRHRELARLEFMQAMESLPMKLTLVTLVFFLPPLLAVILVPQFLQFLALW